MHRVAGCSTWHGRLQHVAWQAAARGVAGCSTWRGRLQHVAWQGCCSRRPRLAIAPKMASSSCGCFARWHAESTWSGLGSRLRLGLGLGLGLGSGPLGSGSGSGLRELCRAHRVARDHVRLDAGSTHVLEERYGVAGLCGFRLGARRDGRAVRVRIGRETRAGHVVFQ
jgi:hypothetical protein